MNRTLLPAVAIATFALFSAIAAGCGGSGAKIPASAAAASSTPKSGTSPTPTIASQAGLGQPTTVDKVLPTPTAVLFSDAIVAVAAGKNSYKPTMSDFKALSASQVSVGGQTYKGVSLATIAAHVSAKTDSGYVTVQGTRSDGKRLNEIRFPTKDVASTTVFVMDSGGHLALYSSSIPKIQWLTAVTAIAFT